MGTNKTLEPQGLSPTVPNFPTIPSPREREKKYIQSRSIAGLCLRYRFHYAKIEKGLGCLREKTHRLTGAGDKKLKAPSKNFYVPIYVPKLKARFYLIVFKRFTNPLTPTNLYYRMPRITAVFSFLIIELAASLTNHRPYYSRLKQVNPSIFMYRLRT